MTDPTPAVAAQVMCSPWAAYADIETWPTPIPPKLDAVTEEQWDAYLAFSSEILYALSGRKWGGGCQETVMLRSHPPMAGQGTWPYEATWGTCGCWSYGSLMDNWLYPPANLLVGTHLAPMAIRLPHDPVIGVQEVLENGTAFTDWRFTQAGWLERTDGLPWVVCLDTTQITYSYGALPPAGGKRAAVLLAIEFAKYDANLACSLPQRVTSVTRQGISFQTIDPMEFLPLGKTGVYQVDLWIQSVNPYANKQRARVFSLDLPSAFTAR